MKRIGVLALQGAVSEHLEQVRAVGGEGVAVKLPSALDGLDGLIIPGGESTAISRLMREKGFVDPIRAFARDRAVMGTCAGLILCGRDLDRPDERVCQLGLMDITVCRNGFGRQRESFEADLDVTGMERPVRAVFIRAPYITRVGYGVDVLAEVDGKPVMALAGRVLVLSFHPELTPDSRIMAMFVGMC